MKKVFGKLALVALLGLAPLSTASALTITVDPTTQVTKVSGAQTWDFEQGTLAATFTVASGVSSYVQNTAAILSTSVAGSAQPFGDSTKYLVVPNVSPNPSDGYLTINLVSDKSYLGMFWGSIDSYNYITFYNDGNQVGKISGATAVGTNANGNQLSTYSNTYVNIYTDFVFDSFKLESLGRAMEIDNLSVAVVPEPATMLLFGAGLAGLAGFARRKRS